MVRRCLRLQDVELDKLSIDVAAYNTRVMGPNHVENVTDLACRTALSYRAVSHITIPSDVQDMEVGKKRTKRNVPHHTSREYAQSARLPEMEDLRRAPRFSTPARKSVYWRAAVRSKREMKLEQVAEALGAPIVTVLLGKGAVPDDSPYATGGVGLLGTAPSQTAMEECDTLLIVGTSFPYIEFYPKPGKARGVQIELDPMRTGLRYPVEVGLVGDSRRTLKELCRS